MPWPGMGNRKGCPYGKSETAKDAKAFCSSFALLATWRFKGNRKGCPYEKPCFPLGADQSDQAV